MNQVNKWSSGPNFGSGALPLDKLIDKEIQILSNEGRMFNGILKSFD